MEPLNNIQACRFLSMGYDGSETSIMIPWDDPRVTRKKRLSRHTISNSDLLLWIVSCMLTPFESGQLDAVFSMKALPLPRSSIP